MSGFCDINMLGNVCTEPRSMKRAGATLGCRFTVACSRKYPTNSGEEKESVLFQKIEIWRDKVATFCLDTLSVGDTVFVQGSLETKSWIDKDENKRQENIANIKNIQIIKSKRWSDSPQKEQKIQSKEDSYAKENEEEIPF